MSGGQVVYPVGMGVEGTGIVTGNPSVVRVSFVIRYLKHNS